MPLCSYNQNNITLKGSALSMKRMSMLTTFGVEHHNLLKWYAP